MGAKWYDMVLHTIKASGKVAHSLLMEYNTLIKCHDGRERSPLISALAQLILNPYYRTLEGFPVLVEK